MKKRRKRNKIAGRAGAANSPPLAFSSVGSAAPASSSPIDPGLPKKLRPSGVIPSFLGTARVSSDAFLPQDDMRLSTTDIEALRLTTITTPALLRKFVKASPDLSAAVFAAIRLGVSTDYTVLARNLDGLLNSDGTRLAQQICRRFNLLGPLEGGWNALPSLRSAAETLGRELFITGACAAELVLSKARLPDGIQTIATEALKFKYNGKRKVPYQVVGNDEIMLDTPAFFYLALDQDPTTAYAESPVQAAIQPILASQAFMNDLRRVSRRAIHPRVRAIIKEELWRKNVPPAVLHDPTALKAFMDATVASIQTLLDGLQPEDALVVFDMLEIGYLEGTSPSLAKEYETLANLINSKLSSGAKAMPVVLGHDAAGSTNIASTQTMIYVKIVEGSVMAKLNELFSRILTLSIRLFGVDAVVEFAYDPVDLRPALELETFKAVRQSRILEQLSVGLISDEEASIVLTRTLPPLGNPRLSGSFFKTQSVNSGNPGSNTSPGQGSALNQTLNPAVPKGVKS